MDFPRTVDEITPEWLTQVLRESGAIREAKVESFSAAGLDGGLVGDVNRLVLTYSSDSGAEPETVVAKLAIRNDGFREIINREGFYEREVTFYEVINSQAGLPTPAVYCAEHDKESGYFILLLEDLGRFRSIKQTDDCSIEDGRTAIHALAKMHSKWWGSDRLYEFDWLTDFTDTDEHDRWAVGFPDKLERFLEIADGYLPAGYESMARRFGGSYGSIRGHYGKSPVTLVHGDFRLGNLVFNGESDLANPIYAFDWQLVSRGKGAVDVAYFLGWSFATASRRRIENRLLTEYHDALVDGGVANYSFDEFSLDVRVGAFRFLKAAINVIGMLGQSLLETEEGTKLIRSTGSRLQTLIDWNCDEVIPK